MLPGDDPAASFAGVNGSAAHSPTMGVSFVVPVYNKAPFLPGVLAALRAQAGAFERQFVFVDDGSTDGSFEIVRRLTAGWENVILHEQENRGSANATNRGVALASMPFVKFLDADDLLARDATRVLLTALEADAEACLAFGAAVRYAEDEAVDLDAPLPRPTAERVPDGLRQALRNSLFNPTQFLARTECVRAVGGCDERIVHSQEYSLTLRLARRWPMLRVRAPVAYLPQRVPGSLGSDMGRQLRRVTLACAHFLRDHPDTEPALQNFACRRAAGRAWKYARRQRGAGLLSGWFWRHVRSRVPFGLRPPEFIEGCARAFG